MNVEERLKEMVIKQYGTIKNFTDHIGIPNSTFANIMRRGVQNANVLTIIKICQALKISTDDLAEGKIVLLERPEAEQTKIEDLVQDLKTQLLNADNLTLDDTAVNEYDILSLVNQIDSAVEVVKKNRRFATYIKKEG